jgi:hypothetical protein
MRSAGLHFGQGDGTDALMEVYLRSSYDPDADYVDGIIGVRPRGSTITQHGN